MINLLLCNSNITKKYYSKVLDFFILDLLFFILFAFDNESRYNTDNKLYNRKYQTCK